MLNYEDFEALKCVQDTQCDTCFDRWEVIGVYIDSVDTERIGVWCAYHLERAKLYRQQEKSADIYDPIDTFNISFFLTPAQRFQN